MNEEQRSIVHDKGDKKLEEVKVTNLAKRPVPLVQAIQPRQQFQHVNDLLCIAQHVLTN
jgi:hypothetical protein